MFLFGRGGKQITSHATTNVAIASMHNICNTQSRARSSDESPLPLKWAVVHCIPHHNMKCRSNNNYEPASYVYASYQSANRDTKNVMSISPEAIHLSNGCRALHLARMLARDRHHHHHHHDHCCCDPSALAPSFHRLPVLPTMSCLALNHQRL